MKKEKKQILFLCTHNSARSQMAEGIINTFFKDTYEAFSAGIEPTQVNPYAIQIMKEIGIDISAHRSKSIHEFQSKHFDYVITVCNNAKENCPFFPGKKIIHKAFDDPAETLGSTSEILAEFRRIRNEIQNWLAQEFQKKSN